MNKCPARFLPLAVAAMALVPALGATTAQAQDFFAPPGPPGQEWLTLDLGGIVNRFNSSVRVNGESHRGSDINLENNSLDRNLSSFEGALIWRFLPNHRFDIRYYGAKRSGSRQYDREIDIGDSTFPLGANVSVQSKNELFAANYRWSFWRTPQVETAFLVGLYGGTFKYDIEAVGISGTAANTYHKSVSTTLPLPVLGFSVDWYIDPRWKVSGELAGMKAKIGDIDGHAYVAAATGEYMIWRGLGVGLRYGWTDINADLTKSDFNGNIGAKTNAVSLYAKLVF
ncbi:MAG TPA: hypothetical protein VFE23_18870 [Usitatibacter sp.]|jgi:hypothetical protein|nr:hypothetical protein [Usitatibacter sp.]